MLMDLVSHYMRVYRCSNKCNENIHGYCVFESKNMLYIETSSGKIKKVCKKFTDFLVMLQTECSTSNRIKIDGILYVKVKGFQINNTVYKRNYVSI